MGVEALELTPYTSWLHSRRAAVPVTGSLFERGPGVKCSQTDRCFNNSLDAHGGYQDCNPAGKNCEAFCITGYYALECTEITRDPKNCGALGRICSAPPEHGRATCSNSKCGIQCDLGYKTSGSSCKGLLNLSKASDDDTSDGDDGPVPSVPPAKSSGLPEVGPAAEKPSPAAAAKENSNTPSPLPNVQNAAVSKADGNKADKSSSWSSSSWSSGSGNKSDNDDASSSSTASNQPSQPTKAVATETPASAESQDAEQPAAQTKAGNSTASSSGQKSSGSTKDGSSSTSSGSVQATSNGGSASGTKGTKPTDSAAQPTAISTAANASSSNSKGSQDASSSGLDRPNAAEEATSIPSATSGDETASQTATSGVEDNGEESKSTDDASQTDTAATDKTKQGSDNAATKSAGAKATAKQGHKGESSNDFNSNLNSTVEGGSASEWQSTLENASAGPTSKEKVAIGAGCAAVAVFAALLLIFLLKRDKLRSWRRSRQSLSSNSDWSFGEHSPAQRADKSEADAEAGEKTPLTPSTRRKTRLGQEAADPNGTEVVEGQPGFDWLDLNDAHRSGTSPNSTNGRGHRAQSRFAMSPRKTSFIASSILSSPGIIARAFKVNLPNDQPVPSIKQAPPPRQRPEPAPPRPSPPEQSARLFEMPAIHATPSTSPPRGLTPPQEQVNPFEDPQVPAAPSPLRRAASPSSLPHLGRSTPDQGIQQAAGVPASRGLPHIPVPPAMLANRNNQQQQPMRPQAPQRAVEPYAASHKRQSSGSEYSVSPLGLALPGTPEISPAGDSASVSPSSGRRLTPSMAESATETILPGAFDEEESPFPAGDAVDEDRAGDKVEEMSTWSWHSRSTAEPPNLLSVSIAPLEADDDFFSSTEKSMADAAGTTSAAASAPTTARTPGAVRFADKPTVIER